MEKTKSGSTHYVEAGEGHPVILIHGVGLDSTIWEQQMKSLSAQYRVISYDMIGHGRSACPPGPYSLSQFEKQLDDLLSDLAIPQAHLVGFSMGGLVAQAYAAHHPDKVSSLTIVSSVAKRTEEQREGVLARVKEVEEHGHQATIDAAIERWFNPAFQSQRPEVVDQIRRRLQTNEPDAYLAAYRVFATADEELDEKLHQIACPTFIITGELDKGSTPEMAWFMAQHIPGAEAMVLPGIRHMLPIEAGEQLNQILLSRMEQCSGKGR